MMTVVVLAVLWLIVVVPMVVRRNDERRRDRSVDGFGRAMRALGRRAPSTAVNAEVFVPNARAAAPSAERPESVGAGPELRSPRVPTRRPVAAAQEALMSPADRAEMSAARQQMMARRRRSLSILIVGTIVFLPLALYAGGLVWLPGLGFTAGIAGYLLFLRSQAMKDRERRLHRQQRAALRRTHDVDATADEGYFAAVPDTAVRIDDDDLELQNMDTIDLTGLYSEELAPAAERRAS
jgi:hypothetical protein